MSGCKIMEAGVDQRALRLWGRSDIGKQKQGGKEDYAHYEKYEKLSDHNLC